TIFRGRKYHRARLIPAPQKNQPVKCDAQSRSRSRPSIRNSEDEFPSWGKCRKAAIEQRELLRPSQILENIKDENHLGPRYFEAAHIARHKLGIHASKCLAGSVDPTRIQVAPDQAALVVPERAISQRNPVSASQVHDCTRAQFSCGQNGEENVEDPVKAQLPSHKATIGSSTSFETRVHESDALSLRPVA